MGSYHNKNTFLWSACGCTVGHQVLYSQSSSLFSCLTQMQHATGVAVVNNMCHGEVLCRSSSNQIHAGPLHPATGLKERRDNRIQREVSLGLTGELRPVG